MPDRINLRERLVVNTTETALSPLGLTPREVPVVMLSIIIPTFNEAHSISRTLDAVGELTPDSAGADTYSDQ